MTAIGGEAAIGWISEVVLDCRDPWALARFWAGPPAGSRWRASALARLPRPPAGHPFCLVVR